MWVITFIYFNRSVHGASVSLLDNLFLQLVDLSVNNSVLSPASNGKEICKPEGSDIFSIQLSMVTALLTKS